MYSLSLSLKAVIVIFPIIAFLITIPYILWHYHKYGSVLLLRAMILYSFLLYLMCSYFLVILPLPPIKEVAELNTQRVQLVPFQFVSDIQMYTQFSVWVPGTMISSFFNNVFLQVFFNIIMFVPLGIYLRYYYRRNIFECLLFSFIVSMFFELTQLSGLYGIYPRPYRLFDIDDLILNTVGGLTGFVVEPIFTWILPSKEKLNELSYTKGQKVTTYRRIMAMFVDWFIIYAFLCIADFAMHIIHIEEVFFLSSVRGFVIYIMIVIITYMIIPYLSGGYTVGKKFVKIKVVDWKNRKAKLSQYFVRYGILYGLLLPALLFAYRIHLYLLEGISSIEYWVGIAMILIMILISIIFMVRFFITCFTQGEQFLYETASRTKQISDIAVPENSD